MFFHETGLKTDKLVESAFNYAQAYTQFLVAEELHHEKKAIEADYKDELDLLKMDLEDGYITQSEYDKEKAALERMQAEDLKEMTTDIISEDLDKTFRDHTIGAAVEIQDYSDNASPSLIAAALLVECARDPVDCKKIEGEFGADVAGMIAEIMHVEAYPGARDENTAAAAPDTKRLMMGRLNNDFREAAAIVAKLKPNQRAKLPEEEVKSSFAEANLLWDNDKKLDARFVEIFNRAAKAVSSPYRIELTAKGAPDLVYSAVKIPAKPKGKKPGTFGDEGF